MVQGFVIIPQDKDLATRQFRINGWSNSQNALGGAYTCTYASCKSRDHNFRQFLPTVGLGFDKLNPPDTAAKGMPLCYGLPKSAAYSINELLFKQTVR
jgi:hypothetical protein